MYVQCSTSCQYRQFQISRLLLLDRTYLALFKDIRYSEKAVCTSENGCYFQGSK